MKNKRTRIIPDGGFWLGIFNILGTGVSNIVDTKKDSESYNRTYDKETGTYINSKGIRVHAGTQKPVFLETDYEGDQILREAGGRIVKNYSEVKRNNIYNEQVCKYGEYITVKQLPHKYDNTCIHNRNNGYDAIGNQIIDLKTNRHYVCRRAYLPYYRVGSDKKGYEASFYMDIYSGNLVRLSDRDTYIETECKKQNKQHMNMEDVQTYINEYNLWHSTQVLNEITKETYYCNRTQILREFMKEYSNSKFYIVTQYFTPINEFDERTIKNRKEITNE